MINSKINIIIKFYYYLKISKMEKVEPPTKWHDPN